MLNLKEKLNKKIHTIGSWITINNNTIAEIYADAGFDWLAIDLEHSTMSLSTMEEMIRIIQLKKIPTLVRLTSNNNDQIKRVLDAGAEGIIVPMVNTKNDIEEAIKATRYPPQGTRGVGLARAQGYGKNFTDYFEWQKKNIVTIAQIENIKAVNAIDEILSTKDLDGFMIGPYDLSCSMNIPGDFSNKKFKDVIKKILEKAKKSNCLPGIHIVEPDEDQLIKAIKDEFKFIAYGVDFKMIQKITSSGIEEFKKKIT